MDEIVELAQRGSRLAAVLEEHWGEEFGESLAEDDLAARGFALARCLNLGWIEPVADLDEPFAAAEAFHDEWSESGGRDDDD